MRWTTAACLGIFAVSAVAFGYSYTITNNNLDTNPPEITMSSDSIKISIADDDDKILEGVTATDSKDGDVTSSLVVENLSNFIEEGVREASIVAFDKDNHISRVTREVTYTDYYSPRFKLSQPLRFSEDTYSYLTYFTAEDCLDGDITAKIHMTFDEDYDYNTIGDVKINVTVANSMGDVSTLPVTMTIYDSDELRNAPTITLTDYLIYVESGESFDPSSYLESVSANGKTYSNKKGRMVVSSRYTTSEEEEEMPSSVMSIDNPVKKKPGVYEVAYTATDSGDVEDDTDDLSTTVRLIVVVTEKAGEADE